MRSAILISLLLHVSVYFISTRIVQFTRVRYVPRQVYSVNLLTMDEIDKMLEKKKEPPAKPPPQQEPEEEAAPPPEESPPPPVPEKKPVKKKEPVKKKQVPSSEVQKPVSREDAGETQQDETARQAATGDMNLDSADFPFGYYLVTIRRKIAGNWSVPRTHAGGEIYCRVHFRIARNGRIVSPEIEQSSGSFMFDQAALRAVMQASPLPPLPGEFHDNFLGVHFSFAYEEN